MCKKLTVATIVVRDRYGLKRYFEPFWPFLFLLRRTLEVFLRKVDEMKCMLCGKNEEGLQMYVLSGHALKNFFPLVGELLQVVPCSRDKINNLPFHVCNECLRCKSK